jgi:uncharacterized protein (TIGR03437 family)
VKPLVAFSLGLLACFAATAQSVPALAVDAAAGVHANSPYGRVSAYNGTPLPKAHAACSATIGGQPANVNYCGAAPYFTAGVLQVNAQVPDSINPGSSVAVTITVGGVTSQANVTLAVQ